MMKSSENNQSNPEIGMKSESFSDAENIVNAEAKNVASNKESGSEAFFDSLDQQYNGQIRDNEVTPIQQSGPKQVTHAIKDEGSKNVVEQSQDGTDWQKRYTDSSREAVKWRDKFKMVEPFVPVLEAMKNDSGLVDHVRDYLQKGGKPAASIQDKLGLPEDFVFDQQEAMTDPESDSAKVMNAHVDGLVQEKVGKMAQAERQKADIAQRNRAKDDEEKAFKNRNNMSEQDFKEFKEKAKAHKMTLDDVNYILNRDKVSANVAHSTKKDMLNQMKNVRTIPTSASGANSQGDSHKSKDREVFDSIMGFDNGTDNLFG
jgi:hypothetical protein